MEKANFSKSVFCWNCYFASITFAQVHRWRISINQTLTAWNSSCSFSSYFCSPPSFIVFIMYGLSACLMRSCISLNIHFNITIRSMRRFLCWQFFAKHVTYNLFDIKCQLNLHHTYWYKLADMARWKSQQRRRNVILSTKRRMKTPIVWINL